MNSEALQGHGPLTRPKWTWRLLAAVGGVIHVTVGFFTVTAIGLISVPLVASIVLVSAWLAAAGVFVLTVRRSPALALLIPVVNGLLLWGVVAAGDIWFGWTA